MSIPPPADPFSRPFDDDTDFGAAFGFGDGMDFGATFGFDADFGLGFDDFDGSFDDRDIDSSGGGRRRQRRTSRYFRIESVKNLCWYRNFTRPGVTRELTHELSLSDRFSLQCQDAN